MSCECLVQDTVRKKSEVLLASYVLNQEIVMYFKKLAKFKRLFKIFHEQIDWDVEN